MKESEKLGVKRRGHLLKVTQQIGDKDETRAQIFGPTFWELSLQLAACL